MRLLAETASARLVAHLHSSTLDLIDAGIYGYNAYLTGLALAVFQAEAGFPSWNYLIVRKRGTLERERDMH